MINNYSRAVSVYHMHILILLSVDEILLPTYVNWFTNLRGLTLEMKMAPSCLKHMNSVLSVFM